MYSYIPYNRELKVGDIFISENANSNKVKSKFPKVFLCEKINKREKEIIQVESCVCEEKYFIVIKEKKIKDNYLGCLCDFDIKNHKIKKLVIEHVFDLIQFYKKDLNECIFTLIKSDCYMKREGKETSYFLKSRFTKVKLMIDDDNYIISDPIFTNIYFGIKDLFPKIMNNEYELYKNNKSKTEDSSQDTSSCEESNEEDSFQEDEIIEVD
jgi:hypothetical protein